jgi:hypothetical protein
MERAHDADQHVVGDEDGDVARCSSVIGSSRTKPMPKRRAVGVAGPVC